MKEKYQKIKMEYISRQKKLRSQLAEIKIKCSFDTKKFKNSLSIEHKNYSQQKSKKDINKNLKKCMREISDFKKNQISKISTLKNEIFANKNEYKNQINEIWKIKNKEKILNRKNNWDNKLEKSNKIFQFKLNKIDSKFNNKISHNNIVITNLRKNIEKMESSFIKEYTNESDYYESEIIAIKNFNLINKIRKNVRFIKKENRNLSDLFESKSVILKSKQLNKANIIKEKYKNALDSNKPGTAIWWNKQGLGAINKGVAKLDQQRHLHAIKTALIYMMPYTLVAAFWILLNNVILSTSQGGLLYSFGIKETTSLSNFKSIGGYVNNATLGIMGLALSIAISAILGDRYNFGKIESGLVGLSAFIMFTPILNGTLEINNKLKIAASFVNFGELGATSMFLSIITGLGGIELYRLFLKPSWLKIKMPKQVPKTVAKSFNVIIPFLLVSFVFASMSFSLLFFAEKNLKEVIEVIVQKPLSNGIESLGGAMLIRIIADGLWILGIHGQNMIGPIVGPIYLEHITQNSELVSQGLDPIWIVTSTFMDSYTLPMNNIVILVSIFIFSRRKDHLSIMLVAFVPALFNISEPVAFGLPVVLNPILALPLVLGSQIITIIAYLATSWGFVTPLYIMTPWTTPSIIGPYIASGGDIRCLFLALFIFAIGIGVFAPFILIANMQAKQFNPDFIVSRFSIKSRLLFRRKETINYLRELESNKKISIKQKE